MDSATASAEARFLRDTVDGPIDMVSLNDADRRRVADLVEQYADFPPGTSDASVVTIAERHKVQDASLSRPDVLLSL